MSVAVEHTGLSRRKFLIRSGWLAGGVTVLTSCSAARSVLPALPSLNDPAVDDALFWVQALPGGRIRFLCPRMEMGQGAPLGLSQVVAEELNVGQADVECSPPDTDETPPFKMTVGSESIFDYFEPVSFGAAQLREALRGLAAEKAGVAVALVQDARGGFVLPDGSVLLYGDLVPSEPLVLSANSEGPVRQYALERKGEYRAIGQAWKHHELEAIVTGKTVYSRDVTLPGMLYGQVVRAPAFGARLKDADGSAAEVMPGVRAVVIDMDKNFVGVVTDDPFVLPAVTRAIEAQWQIPEDLNQDRIEAVLDVERYRARDDFEHELTAAGDMDAGRDRAVHQAAGRYDTPFEAHAQMEPRAGVVWVRKDKVEVWCGSQDPFFVQRRVAKAIGRAGDDVVVHSHRMGGGFGGRVQCQASEEAAVLSAAVGQPVRVQWDRETEFQSNYFQPMFSHFIDAGVTSDGKISHWDHDFVSSPIMTGPMPKGIAWVADRVMADGGTSRGALSPYRLPDHRVRYSDIRTAVPIGAWRGLGASSNNFAIESMIDELASASGIDPLELRLMNLPPEGERLAAVLRRAAEISQLGRPVGLNMGRGLACAVYKGQTAVAVVAEVLVDHELQDIRVTEIWCAQDCGLVVNPDQVENQVMGNIAWGCSWALKERITIKAGAVQETNFDVYEILRHGEAPEMTVALVEPPDTAPVAVGESAFGPVAPAIANAVFAATGRRVRRLPMRYDSVFSDG